MDPRASSRRSTGLLGAAVPGGRLWGASGVLMCKVTYNGLIFASPNVPLSNLSRLGRRLCEHGAHAPHRQTHCYRGFRPSSIPNASMVFIFASPNTPPWRNSLLERLKCEGGARLCVAKNAPLSWTSPLERPKRERGANFRMAKRTPTEDFVPWASKMQAKN